MNPPRLGGGLRTHHGGPEGGWDLWSILTGRPANKDDVADYVLEDFTKPEKLLLRAMYGDLSELLLSTVNLIVNPQGRLIRVIVILFQRVI